MRVCLTYVTVKLAFNSFSAMVCGSGGDTSSSNYLLPQTGNHFIYYIFVKLWVYYM